MSSRIALETAMVVTSAQSLGMQFAMYRAPDFILLLVVNAFASSRNDGGTKTERSENDSPTVIATNPPRQSFCCKEQFG
jgi:hypothetical protein